MKSLAFQQVDVFTAVPFKGNPVAVVLEGDSLSSDKMQSIAGLDQPVRDDLRLHAIGPPSRLSAAHLHA